jgi:hypothetical protein
MRSYVYKDIILNEAEGKGTSTANSRDNISEDQAD